MDELLRHWLKTLENSDNDVPSVTSQIYDKLKFEEEDEDEDNKKYRNHILCDQFLKYYHKLIGLGWEYPQVEKVTSYLAIKHRNIMTIANSKLSNQDFKSDIYLNYEQQEDFIMFINWYKENFQQKD